MSRLEMILSASLLASLIFNVGVVLYARTSLAHLLSVSEELGDLQRMVNAFANHVKSVYELESFYGDQTLEHLMHHAASLREHLETFEYIYSLTEIEDTAEEEEDEDYVSEITEEVP